VALEKKYTARLLRMLENSDKVKDFMLELTSKTMRDSANRLYEEYWEKYGKSAEVDLGPEDRYQVFLKNPDIAKVVYIVERNLNPSQMDFKSPNRKKPIGKKPINNSDMLGLKKLLLDSAAKFTLLGGRPAFALQAVEVGLEQSNAKLQKQAYLRSAVLLKLLYPIIQPMLKKFGVDIYFPQYKLFTTPWGRGKQAGTWTMPIIYNIMECVKIQQNLYPRETFNPSSFFEDSYRTGLAHDIEEKYVMSDLKSKTDPNYEQPGPLDAILMNCPNENGEANYQTSYFSINRNEIGDSGFFPCMELCDVANALLATQDRGYTPALH